MMKSISFVRSFFMNAFANVFASFSAHGVAVLLAVLLCTVGCGDDDPKPAPTFKVASYNINYGNVDLKEILTTIRKADADVVALQEINNTSARYLKKHLSKLYPHMRFRPTAGGGGFGFLSKVKFRRVAYIKPSKDWFGTYLVEVKLAGQIIEIANLHLCPTLPHEKDTLKSFLRRAFQTQKRRSAEIRAIYPKLSKKHPRIIVGDFNSPAGSFVPVFLERKGMIDSYKTVTPKPKRTNTWSWEINGQDFKLRIDYIFHSPVFKTLGSEIFRSDASDHFLICSTLDITPKGEIPD